MLSDLPRPVVFGVALGAIFIPLWWMCASPSNYKAFTAESLLDDVQAPESLTSHWQQALAAGARVEKVVDGVYVAIGYSLGNSILIEAPDGLIIVDTTENADSARLIKEQFRLISQKPIRAIIYTHCHHDHILGSRVFAEGETSENIEVWAHHTFLDSLYQTFYVSKGLFTRSARQFGLHLQKVVGPKLRLPDEIGGFLLPTNYVHGANLTVNIAGRTLTLIHIPGETDDHMAVWLPDLKIVMPGDDIYKSFPNLYAIRGTVSRNTLQWARSLRLIRSLRAEILVPSHLYPLHGQKEVYGVLTAYGDAVQLIHDQTVRYINKGIHPDEIVNLVRLPPALAAHAYLQEFYGTVEWSVKGVYNYYLGWFNGRVDNLLPMLPQDRARRLLRLIGSSDRVLHEARESFSEGNERWALELATLVLDVEPDNVPAKEIRANVLKSVAAKWPTYNGRNYILTTILEDFGVIQPLQERNMTGILEVISSGMIFEIMATRLKAEEANGIELVAIFNFTDSHEVFTLTIRHNVLEVEPFENVSQPWNVKFTTTTKAWKSLLTKKTSALSAYMSGDIVVEGGISTARQFLQYFET